MWRGSLHGSSNCECMDLGNKASGTFFSFWYQIKDGTLEIIMRFELHLSLIPFQSYAS